jgi:hypothetical protein
LRRLAEEREPERPDFAFEHTAFDAGIVVQNATGIIG